MRDLVTLYIGTAVILAVIAVYGYGRRYYETKPPAPPQKTLKSVRKATPGQEIARFLELPVEFWGSPTYPQISEALYRRNIRNSNEVGAILLTHLESDHESWYQIGGLVSQLSAPRIWCPVGEDFEYNHLRGWPLHQYSDTSRTRVRQLFSALSTNILTAGPRYSWWDETANPRPKELLPRPNSPKNYLIRVFREDTPNVWLKELVRLGKPVLPHLKEIRDEVDHPEIKKHAARLLEYLSKPGRLEDKGRGLWPVWTQTRGC